ncbi:MAG: hypothetical protein ACRDHG_04075, partial [Anaerolineales bacterium]
MTKPKPSAQRAAKSTAPSAKPTASGKPPPEPRPTASADPGPTSSIELPSPLGNPQLNRPEPSPEPVDIPLTVEPHRAEGPSLLSSILSLGEGEGAPEPAKRKRGRPPKQPTGTIKLAPADLANLLLVPGVMFVASRSRLPELARPLREETYAFVLPAANIIVRHAPSISASADMIDLGRMVLAGLHWQQRVAPILEAARKLEAEGGETENASPSENGRTSNRIRIVEPTPSRTGLPSG